MATTRPRYQGGVIGDRDAFRLVESEMSDGENEADRAAWWSDFPAAANSAACARDGPSPAEEASNIGCIP